jgi:hypothetical protein
MQNIDRLCLKMDSQVHLDSQTKDVLRAQANGMDNHIYPNSKLKDEKTTISTGMVYEVQHVSKTKDTLQAKINDHGTRYSHRWTP